MTTPAPWLERLTRATDYRELQLVFTEIATEAGRTTDRAALAAHIDEAILRIERERLRDEDELRSFEREYESFKESKSGVVGWLKRHVPFTETRRQDQEKQQAVEDQRAELLADNMVIARAQMLKESLLEPEARALGLGPTAWRRRLESHEAVAGIREYADALIELGREFARGGAFVEAIDADLDAFARAKFASKEDRARRDEDLKAARAELAVCRQEVDDEVALRAQGIARLRELITSELTSRDGSFGRLTDRVSRLTAGVERAKKIEESLLALGTDLESARTLAETLEALPAEREAKEEEAVRLTHQVDDAERSRLRASSHAAEQAARAKEAEEHLANARAAVNDAKRAFDAHVAATGQAEMPAGASFETSSPEAEQLARAEKALAEMQSDHRAAKAVHDQAASEYRDAEGDATALRQKIERLREEAVSLDRDGDRLRRELADAMEHAEPALDRLPRDVGDYRSTLEPLDLSYAREELEGRLLPHRRFRVDGFGDRHPAPDDVREALDRLTRLKEATAKEREALARDAEADRRRRDELLRARCQELLNDELAREVCP